eukprot:COSAG02_NODE_44514_length_365_cov_1.248120_1_plen_22_part_01
MFKLEGWVRRITAIAFSYSIRD